MAAHSDAIAVNDEGIILRTSLPPKPTPATPLRRQQFVCDCMEAEPELSTSPSSVVDFPDLPCGILPPALPLVTNDPLGVDAAVDFARGRSAPDAYRTTSSCVLVRGDGNHVFRAALWHQTVGPCYYEE